MFPANYGWGWECTIPFVWTMFAVIVTFGGVKIRHWLHCMQASKHASKENLWVNMIRTHHSYHLQQLLNWCGEHYRLALGSNNIWFDSILCTDIVSLSDSVWVWHLRATTDWSRTVGWLVLRWKTRRERDLGQLVWTVYHRKVSSIRFVN